MILLIDNYDSFTYNLYHLLRRFAAAVRVVRNDAQTVEALLAESPERVVLSPGPGRPEQAGVCVDLLRRLPPHTPVLGVCLGHQALAVATGGTVGPAPTLVHGKTSVIHHRHSPLFRGVPNPFRATRYHSLAVEADSVRHAWHITAMSEDGVVMAMEHRERPWVGVQFHPESVLTDVGERILGNFFRYYRMRKITPEVSSEAPAGTREEVP